MTLIYQQASPTLFLYLQNILFLRQSQKFPALKAVSAFAFAFKEAKKNPKGKSKFIQRFERI
jgi:hypothetical protein